MIEDSRDNDTGITDRMALFSISTVNIRDYFQKVIDVVTSDCCEDLEVSIDNATLQCCMNSKFKDPPVDSSTVQQSNNKMPATETIKKPANSDETIQHLVMDKNPDGTFQCPKPSLNFQVVQHEFSQVFCFTFKIENRNIFMSIFKTM